MESTPLVRGGNWATLDVRCLFRKYCRYPWLIEYISGYKMDLLGQGRLLNPYIRRHIHETEPFHDDGFVGIDEAHNAYASLAAADFRERVVRNSSFAFRKRAGLNLV